MTWTPAPGDVLEERYLLQEPLGEGGVGLVFRAVSLRVQREVAVKILQNEALGEHAMRPRFEQEALTLAALSHPNIVRLQDYGVTHGRPYLVMELAEGDTLHALLRASAPLPVVRALSIARQLAYALAYAHVQGVVHRDLKPLNVIVRPLPHQPEHVTVLDFGFAKFLPGSVLELGAPVTQLGTAFGSPAYISPEQCVSGAIDGRADLYSLGVMLFEMLVGTPPFSGEVPQLLRQHLASPVPRLAERNAALADAHDLQLVLDRLLAKSRDERFASAAELIATLDGLIAASNALSLGQALRSAWQAVVRGA